MIFFKIISKNKLKYKLDFNKFINNIDNYKYILNLKTNNKINISYNILDVIKFIISHNNDYFINKI